MTALCTLPCHLMAKLFVAERSHQLESNIADLESSIEAQHEQASAAIEQWEERCNVLSEKTYQLEKEITESGWEGEKIVELRSHLETYKESDNRKEAALEKLNTQVRSMGVELTNARQKNDKILLERAESAEKLSVKNSEIQVANARILELTQHLESERNALAQGQGVKKQLEELLEAERLSRTKGEKQYALQIASASSKCKTETESHVQELQDTKHEVDETIMANRRHLEEQTHLWENRNRALEETIAKVERELDERTEELKCAKHQADNHCIEKQVKEETMKLAAELATAHKFLNKARSLKAEMEISHEAEKIEWEKARKALLEKISDSRSKELEAEFESGRKKLDDETHAMEEMKQIIAELESSNLQLQQELFEADEALQSRLTDEVSSRATETASEALRAEMNKIRAEQRTNRKAFEDEQQLRLSVEEEVQRIRSLLSQGVPKECLDSHYRTMSANGDDQIIKIEREEVEKLRKSLERVMSELNLSRTTARDAEERATNAKLRASVHEKEAIGAKADLTLLRQTLEELKESDMNARASFEYRISALEDDCEALRRSHTDEIEGLKSDLAQVNMEKERLMHSLAESEKANAALVYATSVQSEQEASSEDAAELARVRLERAQLLAAATEVGARTERRIREAVAASAASIEAELILEREQRQAAESAVEDFQAQIEDMKERTNTGFDTSPRNRRKDANAKRIVELENELKTLKAAISKVKNENREIKNKFDKSEADTKAVVIKLTEKCRHAETKAREIEREGRFEAAVAAEIARLRAEYTNPAEDQLGEYTCKCLS